MTRLHMRDSYKRGKLSCMLKSVGVHFSNFFFDYDCAELSSQEVVIAHQADRTVAQGGPAELMCRPEISS